MFREGEVARKEEKGGGEGASAAVGGQPSAQGGRGAVQRGPAAVLGVVGNIPKSVHTADLRAFFSTEVEEGRYSSACVFQLF